MKRYNHFIAPLLVAYRSVVYKFYYLSKSVKRRLFKTLKTRG